MPLCAVFRFYYDKQYNKKHACQRQTSADFGFVSVRNPMVIDTVSGKRPPFWARGRLCSVGHPALEMVCRYRQKAVAGDEKSSVRLVCRRPRPSQASCHIFCPRQVLKNGRDPTEGEHRQARFCRLARSASTMIWTNSGKRTLGCQPRARLALDASPTSRSTSAGRL
jgi:hypothetical protein